MFSRGPQAEVNPLEQARGYVIAIKEILERDPLLVEQTPGRYQNRLLLPWGVGVLLTNTTRRQPKTPNWIRPSPVTASSFSERYLKPRTRKLYSSVFGRHLLRVCGGGKQSFKPRGKQRLIEACGQPGVSLSRMAPKASVNANPLRKWSRRNELREAALRVLPALVPVVTVDGAAPPPAAVTPSMLQTPCRPHTSP